MVLSYSAILISISSTVQSSPSISTSFSYFLLFSPGTPIVSNEVEPLGSFSLLDGSPLGSLFEPPVLSNYFKADFVGGRVSVPV